MILESAENIKPGVNPYYSSTETLKIVFWKKVDILFENDDSISLLVGKKYPVITPKKTAVDIDTEIDFKLIELLMEEG